METQGGKPKRKPTKIEEMTKEQIRQAILKKRECNNKAQSIVETLLEKEITEDYFIQCLPDINQCHFDDVIEERSIIHLCGYPVCSKQITERDIPKQKYRISTKTNKIYDITARKSFCSNVCYKSAMFVKKQMLTSPLWFREYEKIPKFQLLALDSRGSLGQEVDLSLTEKLNAKEERSFSSINDFANASLNSLTKQYSLTNKDENTDMKVHNENIDLPKNNSNSEAIYQNTSANQQKTPPAMASNSNILVNPTTKTLEKKIVSNPFNIVGEIVEKRPDPILVNVPEQGNRHTTKLHNNLVKKKQHSVTIITIEVEKCLAEWFTLETMLFLFGEEKVKEMVTDKGECIKEYLNNFANGLFYSANSYDQYQLLCRKLNMIELEDRRYDAQTLKHGTKPLPDYSMLKEESKTMQLKVRAFFAGETNMSVVEGNENEHQEMSKNGLTQLPLVDKNAQNALRRRIVYQHLNKVLPDLLKSLGLSTLSISSDVRLLIKTFKLKANNIMFKPIQWTLIAIVVIKLLSIKDKQLEYLLEQQTAYQHMQLLLLSYKQDGGYLDRLISWLTDIDRLLDVNDTQLTVE